MQILWSQSPLWIKYLGLKKGIIQSNIHRILPKINQVIMYPNCLPDIMILAQAVLQIFMSQDCFTLQSQIRTRDIIRPNIYRTLPNVNQVINILDANCTPNIMILAQAVIQIFWSQNPLSVKRLSLKRGHDAVNYSKNFRSSTSCTQAVRLILGS